MQHLGWYDDNKKKSDNDKIGEAIAAFKNRFKVQPRVVVVNESCEVKSTDTLIIRKEARVRPNIFLVGME